MPGSPSSASTLNPESSAKAGKPVARVAASALSLAFPAKVQAVSSGSGKFKLAAELSYKSNGSSRSRISVSYP